MLAKRIIPCLDVAAGRVVKGIHFVDLRDAGDPAELGRRYYLEGADELVFLDITASFEERNTRIEWVRRVADSIFIPFTVGGGISALEQIQELLRAGADKVSMNSAAVRDPQLIRRSAAAFGSQCIVLAVDAKKTEQGWRVFVKGGREETSLDALQWVQEGAALGAGEILLTSMDRDGTRQGYDLELLQEATSRLRIPVIASGGAGSPRHLLEALREGRADAVLAASIFHYDRYTVSEVKEFLRENGVPVRMPAAAAARPLAFSGPLDWEKGQGLIPAVVQDAGSGKVLMLGYMNRESLERTLESGLVSFWSRSRQQIWTKGETSGNYLRLKEIRPDCDLDALLLIAQPEGPVCHRGTRSCFGEDHQFVALEFLSSLEDVIRGRKQEMPEGSYTSRLFSAGPLEIAKKLGEEAIEVVLSGSQARERSIQESADLLYHLLVFLTERGISLQQVISELERRHGTTEH